MGSFSIWHWLIVGAVVMLLFGGRGKVSELMGDMAKGIKAFKKGLAEDDTVPQTTNAPPPAEPIRPIEHRGESVSARGEPISASTLADRKLG